MSILQGAINPQISGGIFASPAAGGSVTIIQESHARGSSAFKDLSSAAAHTALHDSAARFDAPRCHRNTRAKYRNQLETWMLGLGEDFKGKQLIWLHGGAGAGKSAIMQSVVEQCAKTGAVLGSFFFSRADSTRNYAEILIPTLAYQVAQAFPEAMVVLEPIIQRNPLIFKASLRTQAFELLVRPLLHLIEDKFLDTTTALRRVFVVDGLDECIDRQKQAIIIRVIASILCEHQIPICFLIASRMEISIGSAFERETKVHGTFTTINLDEDRDAESDIRTFIEDSFLDILDGHPWKMDIELPWPSRRSIDNLVWKSSEHFIYAATAMRFIASSDEHPARALLVVEGLEPSRTGSPLAELDTLYMHILTSGKHAKKALEILRYIYLSSFDSGAVFSVCFAHHITPQDVSLFLSEVKSLVALAPDDSGELCIVPKHASLRDFLWDEERSQELYMTREHYHASFLVQYFQLLDDSPLDLDHRHRLVEDFVRSLTYALKCSEDADLLRSMVASHSPYDLWNFCIESMSLEATTSSNGNAVRLLATRAISVYMYALRDSIFLCDDALYSRQVKMYIELVLDDINDIVHTKPQYSIISALMFSSGFSGLSVAHDLMHWDEQFHVGRFTPSYVFHPLQRDGSRKIDRRAFEAIRDMPQGRISWSSDLAVAMELVLQQLIHLSGPSPFMLQTSPHMQWLRRHKSLKQISLGSPRLSSATTHRFTEVNRVVDGNGRRRQWTKMPRLLLSCWQRLLHWEPYKFGKQRHKYRALLKAVILYLHRADCTNEVVILARKSLPMATLWFPKLMKKARAEMDAYVCQWEESPDGLMEMSKSLHINEID